MTALVLFQRYHRTTIPEESMPVAVHPNAVVSLAEEHDYPDRPYTVIETGTLSYAVRGSLADVAKALGIPLGSCRGTV